MAGIEVVAGGAKEQRPPSDNLSEALKSKGALKFVIANGKYY